MSRPDSSAEIGRDEPDPRRWKALAVTLAAGFMTLLDVSIVNVALPSIQRGLHASSAGAQWVVTGYALTFGLALVAGGRLGDLVGRRRMFLIALTGFVLTSAAAGAAPNELLLIVARLLQGLTAGMLTPQNTGLIQSLFRGAERGRAFGIFGSTIGVSTAAGPVIGGAILTGFGPDTGWRWIFYVNVPIGILALVLAARLVPGAPPRQFALRSQIDFVGAGLLGLAVVCVLLPLVQSTSGGTPLLWVLLPVAVACAWWFVVWEGRVRRRSGNPLLDLRLFTQAPGYASGIALGTVYFCGFSGIWLVLAIFLQNGLGYSPLRSGLTVTPFAIGSAVTAVVAGRLVERWGRRLTIAGLCLLIVGLGAAVAMIFSVDPAQTELAVAAPLFIAGVGGGCVVSPNITLTLERVPTRMAGAAGGALQTGQRIGTAIGTAALAAGYRLTLSLTGGRYPLAATVALLCAVGFMVIALVLAVLELRARVSREESDRRGQDLDDRVSACDVQR